MGERWTPGIGDPTVLGWAAVAGYFAAALLCLVAGIREHRSGLPWRTGAARGRRPEFWFVLALALACLGINKQLDLQSWLTQTGRDIATYGGWYGERRSVQAVFVAAVAGCGLTAMLATYRYLHASWGRYRFAYYGLVYLVSFVVIRAASFHHVDLLLQKGEYGIQVNHLLEFGGIALTAYGASRAAQQGTGQRARRYAARGGKTAACESR